MSPLTVTILYDKANGFGLLEDTVVWERLLKKLQDSIGQPIQKPAHRDIREPLIHCDIQIHLEIPIYAAIPWAHTNILLVNPEQWMDAYDAYAPAFDLLLVRDQSVEERFRSKGMGKGIPWASSWVNQVSCDTRKEFVCFLGGSLNKYNYLKELLPHWKSTDPPLTIYTTRNDFRVGLQTISSVVTVVCQDVNQEARRRIMAQHQGHLIVSKGEGFGYAAAEAEMVGAFAIMNRLPVFMSTYSTGVAWLAEHSSHVVREELDAAFEAFLSTDVCAERKKMASMRFPSLCAAFLPLLQHIQSLVYARRPSKGVFHCPPLLHIQDCPPITIITPTYNRKQLIEIAFHNLLATDYPHDKIEWIVIEDNEKTPHMASEKIIQFQLQVPTISMKYMPVEGRMSIGEKRNCAIKEASHDIILFMDDDDHYPSTSFRRRVAWLTKGVKGGQTTQTIACCTTLALYDLMKGTSAVNVPPYSLPLSQRISEATLTFRKSAWEERPFPHVSIAEGEGWIHGRENQVIEIPPQQIIVAFTHGNNQSSRNVPSSDTPSCFWGFPKEYLIFVHGLAGVQIEEDTRTPTKRR